MEMHTSTTLATMWRSATRAWSQFARGTRPWKAKPGCWRHEGWEKGIEHASCRRTHVGTRKGPGLAGVLVRHWHGSHTLAQSTFQTVEVAGEKYEVFTGRVKKEYFQVQFVRSSGPGGQNVNKVNTKAEIRFNVEQAQWLPERAKANLMEAEKNRINKDGELVISSSRYRTQQKNLEDALAKVQHMVVEASTPPPEPSADRIKRAKKLARAFNESRIKDKKKNAQKKSERRRKDW